MENEPMSKFVKLTDLENRDVWVNPDLVTHVGYLDDPGMDPHLQGKTVVYTEVEHIIVQEPPHKAVEALDNGRN